jgi:SpoVK/Ycf46/Vps4 family AAA+-type ATPase
MVLRRLGIRGAANLGEARKLRVEITEPGQHPVRFASVGGAAAAKAALLRLCAPLHITPSSEARVEETENKSSGSHKATQGAMRAFLHGPHGCGKTLLAHALAGELNLPLLTVSASEIAELVATPSRAASPLPAQLRELFVTASRRAPCVVFIDDIEAIARKRESAAASPAESPGEPARATSQSAEHEVCDEVLQQLLTSLDGLPVPTSRVVVLAASDRIDLIDEALLRPGRLARQIALGMPDERERAEIIALLARNHTELGELDVLALAARTRGYSGAGLRELLARAAALVATRSGEDTQSPPIVEPNDLARAMSECPPS